MKRRSITEGIIIACLCMLAFIPAKLVYLFVFNGAFSFRLIWSTLALVYLIMSGALVRQRVGAIVLGTVSVSALFCGTVFLEGFQICLLCTLTIWALRSVYRYTSFISSGIDLVLSAAALTFSMWAYQTTGSLALMLWSFYLVQALSALIPQKIGTPAIAAGVKADRFENAYGNAERALREIISQAA